MRLLGVRTILIDLIVVYIRLCIMRTSKSYEQKQFSKKANRQKKACLFVVPALIYYNKTKKKKINRTKCIEQTLSLV